VEVTACPACGTLDIRLETTATESHKVVSWRSGEERPVFVAERGILDSKTTERIVCTNGHAHPNRVGFDLEWADSG